MKPRPPSRSQHTQYHFPVLRALVLLPPVIRINK
jgi:hypothetical protein